MIDATDRRSTAARLGLALGLLAGLGGCARLQTLRSTTGWSASDAAPPPAVGSVRSGDTYASRLDHGSAPEGERLADADRPAPDRGPASNASLEVALRVPSLDDAATRQSASVVEPVESARSVVASCRAHLDAIGSYRVSMTRRERVGSSLQPPEDVVLSVRRNPRGVRIEWPSGPNAGREALFEAAPGDGLLHVLMPKGIVNRTALPPNSPLVLRNSRHPITEAGFDSIVESLESDLRRPAPHGLTLAGRGPVEGSTEAVIRLERRSEEGETWVVGIDPRTSLPAVVLGTGPDGSILEDYRFRDVQANPADLSAEDAFRSEARWGPAPGLFGRR